MRWRPFAETGRTGIVLGLERFAMGCSALAMVVISLLAPPGALASVADERLAEGNRLFREDLYWAALLRYREAQEAGLDSPVV